MAQHGSTYPSTPSFGQINTQQNNDFWRDGEHDGAAASTHQRNHSKPLIHPQPARVQSNLIPGLSAAAVERQPFSQQSPNTSVSNPFHNDALLDSQRNTNAYAPSIFRITAPSVSNPFANSTSMNSNPFGNSSNIPMVSNPFDTTLPNTPSLFGNTAPVNSQQSAAKSSSNPFANVAPFNPQFSPPSSGPWHNIFASSHNTSNDLSNQQNAMNQSLNGSERLIKGSHVNDHAQLFPGHASPPEAQNTFSAVQNESQSLSTAEKRRSEEDPIRAEVKKAIQELHAQGIKFDELLAEKGHRNEQFLVQIWTEVGLPLPERLRVSDRAQDPPAREIGNVQSDQIVLGADVIRPSRTPRLLSENDSNPFIPPTRSSDHRTSSRAEGSLSYARSFQDVANQDTNNDSSRQSPPIQQSNGPMPKLHVTQESIARPKSKTPVQEERKDKIARLMAQKKSKLHSPRPDTSTQNASPQPAKPPMVDAHDRTSVDAPQQTSDQSRIVGKFFQGAKESDSAKSLRPRGNEATLLALRKIEEQKQMAALAARKTLAGTSPDPANAQSLSDSGSGSDNLFGDEQAEKEWPSPESETEVEVVQVRDAPAPQAQNIFSSNISCFSPTHGSSNNQQSPTGIPGLFMTAPIDPGAFLEAQMLASKDHLDLSSNQQPIQQSNPETASFKPRLKRPVASDFDDEPVTTPNPFKRPFGRIRQESRVVIDVSDDSSEGELDDEDEQEPGEVLLDDSYEPPPPQKVDQSLNSQAPVVPPQQLQSRSGIRDLPPLIDYPSRAATTPRSLVSGANSALNTPPVNDRSKLSTQNDLKKKEEEIQKMQKKILEMQQKRAKQSQIQSQSHPPSASNGATTAKLHNAQIANATTLLVAASRPSPDRANDKVQSIERSTSVSKEVAAQTQGDAESRKQRQAQLKASLLAIRAAEEEARTKSEQHEMEQKRWQSVLKEREDKKRQLQAELDDLGTQVKNDATDLEIKKQEDKLSQLQTEVSRDKDALSKSNTSSASVENHVKSTSPAIVSAVQNNASQLPPQLEVPDTSEHSNTEPPLPETHIEHESSLDRSMEEGEISDGSGGPTESSASFDPKLPSQNLPIASEQGRVLPVFSAEPNEIAQEHSKAKDRASASNEKFVQTSPAFGVDSRMQNEDDIAMLSDDSEDYEPPEASSSPSSDHLIERPVHDELPIIDFPLSNNIPTVDTESRENPVQTDIEIGLTNDQPSMGAAEGPAVESSLIPEKHNYFEPYKSPLKQLRSYRTHPDFLQEIPGGFQSLTYSDDIDPHKEWCQYEASGGICNDASCKAQHYRDMVQGSSSEQAFLQRIMSELANSTVEERQKYAEDLKRLIGNLSHEKKPFDKVAAAILSYRRQLARDPSRLIVPDL